MLRIALVGCGAAGINHLSYMLKTKGLKVVSVCDVNKDFAARAGKLAKVPHYSDAEEMMKNEKLDAAAVITTANAHYPVAKLAAKYKLHVICEKPLTLRPEEGEELIKLFKKEKLILAVTYTYRYVDTTRKMKALIDKGVIGKVNEIRQISWGGKAEKYKAGSEMRIKYDRMYQSDIKGILFDCGVHTFDLFRWFSGEEYVKFVGMGVCHMGYEYPDSGTILCEMTGGVRGIYEHGPLPHYLGGQHGICLSMIVVSGTKGSIVWKIVNKKKKKEYLSEFQLNTEKSFKITEMPIYSKCRDRQYVDFVKSVKQGSLAGSFPTPEDANLATKAGIDAMKAVMKNIVGK